VPTLLTDLVIWQWIFYVGIGVRVKYAGCGEETSGKLTSLLVVVVSSPILHDALVNA
jgi:hypothetical protein